MKEVMTVSLLQMSFYGAVLTIVVMAIRALAVNRLPKRTFIVLWGVVLIRLLIPFEIPSEYSVYSLIGYNAGVIPAAEQAEPGIMQRILQGLQKSESQSDGMTESEKTEISNGEPSIPQSAVSDEDLSTQLTGKFDDGVSAQLSGKLSDGVSAQPSGKLSDGVSAQLSGKLNDGVSALSSGMPDGGVSAQLSGKLNDRASAQLSGISNAEGLAQPSEMTNSDADILESREAGGSILAKLTNKVNKISSLTWMIIWGVGAAFCMIFFTITYLRCRIEFGMSLPVQNEFVEQWLEKRQKLHWFRQPVTARVSDRIDTPLTYGVIKPVILLPKKTEWEETEQLEYVLCHEYMHIRYGDNVLKLIAVAALCIHWFNPFVWAVYFLLNRDIELACDESVIRRYGIGYRSTYANMLISMEAKRSGLMPLCNNFSQNAIEERVRAIMKIKKISLGAVIFAVGLVVGVTTAFATSAAGDMGKESNHYENTEQQTNQLTDMSHEGVEKKNIGGNNTTELTDRVNANSSANTAANQTERMEIFNAEFTPEEYDKLRALQFDGYEDMTISEFQNKVWTLYDTVEYRELLNRFSELSDRLPMNESFYENRDDIDGTICYLSNVLEPLTAEQWRKRDFSGYVSTGLSNTPENVIQDMAVLEYVMTLTILDADRLTVGEYIFARFGMKEAIEGNIFSPYYYSAGDLADQEWMQVVIGDTMTALTAEFSKDELQVNVEWVYKPLDALETYMDEVYVNEESQKESLEQWETVLKPYIPFGLTWDYDARNDEVKMYFRGREVRGIVDEEKNIWIAEHAGIGENVYAEDAIELYAVYENGQLTGLRAATKEEQEEWTLRRRQTTDGYHDLDEEVREFLPGTKEDYQSILSLKKSGYEQMTLADFNSALLKWGNEHSDSYDRISCDTGWDDFRVDLSDEDKEFIVRTVSLSGDENAMAIRSHYTGRPEEDVSLGDGLTKTPDGDEAAYVWCNMYYGFSYHISDKEKVTVGERDRCIGGMLDGIQEFWDQTDIEDILKMEKADIIKKLDDLARKYSTKNVTITVRAEDQIGFECMDERELMRERMEEEEKDLQQ